MLEIRLRNPFGGWMILSRHTRDRLVDLIRQVEMDRHPVVLFDRTRNQIVARSYKMATDGL